MSNLNTTQAIAHLQETVATLVAENPKATVKTLCKACEKQLQIKPIRFDKPFVTQACRKFNVQWNGKK
jgi:hypothetical protein